MPKTEMHPALRRAPKTLRQSLERIRDFMADEERHAKTCSYSTVTGRHCVIGQFFTAEQLSWIRMNGHNSDNITSLNREIGMDNLMAMTRLSLDQASALQGNFDDRNRRRYLLVKVRAVLNGENKFIGGTEFAL